MLSLKFQETCRRILTETKSHHCILIIDFNNNDGGVVSELAGFTKQLHVLKDQQLVPRWAQCLSQNLNRGPSKRRWRRFCAPRREECSAFFLSALTSVTWLCVEKKTLAKGSDRPVLSAANRLRAWYMWTLNWKICFTVTQCKHQVQSFP